MTADEIGCLPTLRTTAVYSLSGSETIAKLLEHAGRQEQAIAALMSALLEIRTFPRQRMPADIANETLAAVREHLGEGR